MSKAGSQPCPHCEAWDIPEKKGRRLMDRSPLDYGLRELRAMKRDIDRRIKIADRHNRTRRLERRLIRAERMRETDRIIFRLTKSEVYVKDALVRLATKRGWKTKYQPVDPARGIAVPYLELVR